MNHNKIGEIGEELACLYLIKHGFKILSKNYYKKWGEIDIITRKNDVLRFIEVKTVSRENIMNVSRETLEQDRPEENIHEQKLKRLYRTIQSYIGENKVSPETDWQFDVIAVFLDLNNYNARIRFMENVVM
mgnify:CR=1 FL=1